MYRFCDVHAIYRMGDIYSHIGNNMDYNKDIDVTVLHRNVIDKGVNKQGFCEILRETASHAL